MEGLNLSGLRNSEFYQFISNALQIVAKNDPAALKAKKHYQRLEASLEEMKKLYKTRKGFVTTEELQMLDTRRDRAITGLAAVLGGFTYHYDESTRKHAEVLADNLKMYGNGSIARENYASETAITTNVVNDWNTKPELSAALTALSLQGWKQELDEANQAFNVCYLARTSEKGAASPDKLREKRLEAAEAWYKLRDRLAAFHEIEEGGEPYGKTVKELTAHVEQFVQLQKGRKGRSNDDPAEEDGFLPEETPEE